MFDDSSDKLPLNRALLWIFLSVVLTCGTALMGWLYYLHLKELRLHDPQYRIIAIVQASPQKEVLKIVYLAECLQLSLDKPVNIYQFDTKKAEQQLLASPLIKEAQVKKIRPGTLYIDYNVRVPVAYLGDYTNTALDTEGYLFPFSPFFTPKKLPTFYLGLEHLEKGWGSCLGNDERLQLAFDVLSKMKERQLNINQIDVSRAFADSYGQKQVIITLEEINERLYQGKVVSFVEPYILRLNTEDYEQNLANYSALKDYFSKQWLECLPSGIKKDKQTVLKPMIIDLRIPQLAFIKKET
jgi:hypothetical protein